MDAYKITFLEDESNVAGSNQGDTENKWSIIYIFLLLGYVTIIPLVHFGYEMVNSQRNS